MRKIFVCMALALCMAAAAAPSDNDTVVVERPRKVRIITGDSVQSVEVWGKEDNASYHYVSNIQLVDSNYVSTSAINDDTWSFSIAGFSKPGRKKSQTECTTYFIWALTMPWGCPLAPTFSHSNRGNCGGSLPTLPFAPGETTTPSHWGWELTGAIFA